MSQKCVLLVSSTNYLNVSAGTEKFIGGIIEAFRKDNIHSIQIFPLTSFNEKIARIGLKKQYIGINYDGFFFGAYLLGDLLEAVGYICRTFDVHCDGVIINQLYNWELTDLKRFLIKLSLPIYIVVHDFMMVCPFMMLKDGDGRNCGLSISEPNEKKCINCKYKKEGSFYFKAVSNFFEGLLYLIKKVIFPSKTAYNIWITVYPKFQEISHIRPHLEYTIVDKKINLNKKIRIAYLGTISDLKGYDEWKTIYHRLNKDKFEFFYLGASINQAKNDGFNTVLVDFNRQELLSMVDQLKRNNIDIAFLWSKCQETYSYTYYEAFQAGCWIVTSNYSGNINSQVVTNKNGMSFDNIENCIKYLSNVKGNIQGKKAINVNNNSNITDLTFPSSIIREIKLVKKPDIFVSLLYRLLRRTNSEN